MDRVAQRQRQSRFPDWLRAFGFALGALVVVAIAVDYFSRWPAELHFVIPLAGAAAAIAGVALTAMKFKDEP